MGDSAALVDLWREAERKVNCKRQRGSGNMRIRVNPMCCGEDRIDDFTVHQMHLLIVTLFYLGSPQAAPVPPPVFHEVVAHGSGPSVHSSIMKSAITQEVKPLFAAKQAPSLVQDSSMTGSMHRSSSNPSLVIKDQRTDRSSMRHAQSESSLKDFYSQYVSDTFQSIYDELLSKVLAEEPVLGMLPENNEQPETSRELEDSTGGNRATLPPARMSRSSRRSDGSKAWNI